jgi:hypothetical protein
MFCFGVFERSVIVKQSKTGRVVISNMFLPVHCGWTWVCHITIFNSELFNQVIYEDFLSTVIDTETDEHLRGYVKQFHCANNKWT